MGMFTSLSFGCRRSRFRITGILRQERSHLQYKGHLLGSCKTNISALRSVVTEGASDDQVRNGSRGSCPETGNCMDRALVQYYWMSLDLVNSVLWRYLYHQ